MGNGKTILEIQMQPERAALESGHLDVQVSAQLIYESGLWFGIALCGKELTAKPWVNAESSVYVGEGVVSQLEFNSLAVFLAV